MVLLEIVLHLDYLIQLVLQVPEQSPVKRLVPIQVLLLEQVTRELLQKVPKSESLQKSLVLRRQVQMIPPPLVPFLETLTLSIPILK